MPSEYIPKVPVLNKNRVQRIAKKLIEEAGEDRRLALEAHRFFRQMVDENPNDGAAKSAKWRFGNFLVGGGFTLKKPNCINSLLSVSPL